MLPRRTAVHNGVEFEIDFSTDECGRRMNEVIRRAMGKKATFDLETGQPYEGLKLSKAELQRRGYL